jgi:UDP-N-acetyl-D-galactosamine dehydrogenase
LSEGKFDAIILAVAHDEYKELNLESIKEEKAVIYDV